MAVRNFYVRGHVSGAKTEISGGPRSKDGGFSLAIYQRDKGSPVKVLQVHGSASEDGKLALWVWSEETQRVIFNYATER